MRGGGRSHILIAMNALLKAHKRVCSFVSVKLPIKYVLLNEKTKKENIKEGRRKEEGKEEEEETKRF